MSPAKRRAPSSDFHLLRLFWQAFLGFVQFEPRRVGCLLHPERGFCPPSVKRQARIFISLNFFGLFSTAHVYIICICIYVYLFLERVCIIVRRGRRTASFWRVNSYGADLHPREAFARQAPSAKLGFSSTPFLWRALLCLVRFEPGRVGCLLHPERGFCQPRCQASSSDFHLSQFFWTFSDSSCLYHMHMYIYLFIFRKSLNDSKEG